MTYREWLKAMEMVEDRINELNEDLEIEIAPKQRLYLKRMISHSHDMLKLLKITHPSWSRQ